MSKIIDMTGKRCGRLVVLCQDVDRTSRQAVWLCRCDCGCVKTVMGKDLRSGNTVSCGCKHREFLAESISGKDHHNWKGGYKIRGSIAWANQVLSKCRQLSKRHGWGGPSPNAGPYDVIALYEISGGRCGICGVPEDECTKKHSLDHNHATGELRGFICTHCNIGLGAFKDSREVLFAAIDYLTHSAGVAK